MIPKFWLSEGGQSISGKLVEYLVETHPFYLNELKDLKENVYQFLNEKLKEKEKYFEMTAKLHIYPDFHGNRSPLANPNLKGMVSGLELNQTKLEDLLTLYLSAIQSVCYGTKHIIEEMNKNGHKIKSIFLCGGLSKNEVFVQELANITQTAIHISSESEVMILGASILAAVAAKKYETIFGAMTAMSSVESVVSPNFESFQFHSKKFNVFQEMYQDQLKYQNLMK
jgi:ribulose kinase